MDVFVVVESKLKVLNDYEFPVVSWYINFLYFFYFKLIYDGWELDRSRLTCVIYDGWLIHCRLTCVIYDGSANNHHR
jgi:hypothetical protein